MLWKFVYSGSWLRKVRSVIHDDFFREIFKKNLQFSQNQEMFMEIDGKWLN